MDYSPTRLLRPWNFLGKGTGVGCHLLLQGIFPTQGSNLGLLHCRQTLYPLSHQGSLWACWSAEWHPGDTKTAFFSLSGSPDYTAKGRQFSRPVCKCLSLATAHWWLPKNYGCYIILIWLWVPIKTGDAWPSKPQDEHEWICQGSTSPGATGRTRAAHVHGSLMPQAVLSQGPCVWPAWG